MSGSRHLVMVDLNRNARSSSDLERLADRLENAYALVAHVRHVDPAVGRSDLGQRDDLVGACEHGGYVFESRGESEGALLHG